MHSNIIKAAEALYVANQNKKACLPIREIIGSDGIELAYETQRVNIQKREAAGARIIGRKIGLTSIAVQKQLGVNQPDYGMLLNDMEVMEGGEITWSECMQPKAEAEIAFILGADLTQANSSISEIISSIEYAVPCIEIVGSRIKDWDIRITDTIADNASASHFVLGHTPKKLTEFDVVDCQMQMFRNGKVESEGNGRACMGSPINATWWLANKMVELGQPLRKGEVVLAGALGPMVQASAGDEFVAQFTDLGNVSVKFSEE
ncbi:MAG: fumarylacetoacetate hydrolase family protein [Bacteroidia bacterium]